LVGSRHLSYRGRVARHLRVPALEVGSELSVPHAVADLQQIMR